MRLAILAGFVLSVCQSTPTPGPSPQYSCDTACDRMKALGCEEGQDTQNGAECAEVCENSFRVGIKQFEWDLKATSTASSCEEN